tara:strand:- start:15297 stop:17000 length:1704 start_codon:yes stop_codon:yes gene_type:complete
LAEDKVKVHYNWEIEDIEEGIKTEETEEDTKKEPKPEKKKTRKTAKKASKAKKEEKIEEETIKEEAEDTEEPPEEEKEEKAKEKPEEEPSDEDDSKEEKPEETFTEEDLTPTGEDKEEEGFKPGYLVAFAAIIIIVILSFFILKTKMLPFSEENVVATINGERVTVEELEKVYSATVPIQYAGFISKEDFLNQSLIPEKILLQEAGKKGIKVDEQEFQEGLQGFLLENGLTEEQLKSSLKENNVDFDDFLENFRVRLIITKLLEKDVSSQIKINDFEIVDYYENNRGMFTAQPGQIRARHILVETEDSAKELLEELKNGADFSELAKTSSTGPSSVVGGDLGFFVKGQMVKEFEDVAFGLEIGRVSGVVKTDFGYHIIKRESNEIPLEEAKERIRLTLTNSKQSSAVQLYIDQLVSKSDIIIKQSSETPITGLTPAETAGTFTETNDPVCKEDGKPVIRMYTTTWCPHCVWISETFDNLVKDYIGQEKIIAYHWDVDTGDNTLTPELETSIPKEEVDIFKRYNPEGSVPTFVFGCRYKRIGNGYEAEDDLKAEEAEFREIIEKLLAE